MTRFVGGPLDGWTEPTSKAEELALPSKIYPTVDVRNYRSGDERFRSFALDQLNFPPRRRVGEYQRWPIDGRYYHESCKFPPVSAKGVHP